MHTTSITLIERLRCCDDERAWERFVHLYTPMIYRWAMRMELSHDVATDLVQEVLTLMVCKLPQFRYDETKSFRGWLRQVTLNRYRELVRRKKICTVPADGGQFPDAGQPDPAEFVEETEYRREIISRAADLIRGDYDEITWTAFWEYVAVGRTPTEVAESLQLSVNSVYLAKSRILKRLRAELDGLL